MCACTVEVVRKVQQTISLTGSRVRALGAAQHAARARGERRATSSRLGRRRGVVILLLLRVLDHLLQLNVHLPWEVVCIGHRLGGGHQHFTTRCVLDAQRGGAFLGASVTTALRKNQTTTSILSRVNTETE